LTIIFKLDARGLLVAFGKVFSYRIYKTRFMVVQGCQASMISVGIVAKIHALGGISGEAYRRSGPLLYQVTWVDLFLYFKQW
jgi:hypothetical protein